MELPAFTKTEKMLFESEVVWQSAENSERNRSSGARNGNV